MSSTGQIDDAFRISLPDEVAMKIIALLPNAPLVCKRVTLSWAKNLDYSGTDDNPWLKIGKFWRWFSIKDDSGKVTLRFPSLLISNGCMIIEKLMQMVFFQQVLVFIF